MYTFALVCLWGQACWDWCTKYVNEGTNKCGLRAVLGGGGEMYCAYKGDTRRVTKNHGFYHIQGHPHPHSCTFFASATPITFIDPDGPFRTEFDKPQRLSSEIGWGPYSWNNVKVALRLQQTPSHIRELPIRAPAGFPVCALLTCH